MKRNFTMLMGLILLTGLSSRSQTITIDGNLTDWNTVPYSHLNNVEGNQTGKTLTASKTFGNSEFLYFYFEGTTDLEFNHFDLYIDSDNNQQTGWLSNNFPAGTTGADLYFEGNTMGGGAILPYTGTNGIWGWGAANAFFSGNVEVSPVVTISGKKAFEFSVKKAVLGNVSNAINFHLSVTNASNVEVASLPQYWHSGAKYVKASLTGSTLPVSLISFSAEELQETIRLNWKTASEQRNSHFEIYRSTDGQQFNKLGTVEGNGNSTAVSSYSFTDRQPASGTNYYQLKQVDLDGTTTEFKVLAVNSKLKENSFSLYQSDGDATELHVYTKQATNSNFSLSDISGKLLYSSVLNLSSGHQILRLPLRVKTGINIATLQTPEGKITQKVLFTER